MYKNNFKPFDILFFETKPGILIKVFIQTVEPDILFVKSIEGDFFNIVLSEDGDKMWIPEYNSSMVPSIRRYY